MSGQLSEDVARLRSELHREQTTKVRSPHLGMRWHQHLPLLVCHFNSPHRVNSTFSSQRVKLHLLVCLFFQRYLSSCFPHVAARHTLKGLCHVQGVEIQKLTTKLTNLKNHFDVCFGEKEALKAALFQVHLDSFPRTDLTFSDAVGCPYEGVRNQTPPRCGDGDRNERFCREHNSN